MLLSSPFDDLAPGYDQTFSASRVTRLLRARVRRRLDAHFEPGQRVLELNCGTGDDAVYLGERGVYVTATDISGAMLRITGDKVKDAGLGARVSVRALDIESLNEADLGVFDGVLSNFGGLNCVSDLPGVARALAAKLKPGAAAVFCVMGPLVPWEWCWFLLRGKPGTAFRRLAADGVLWRGIRIRYPSANAMRTVFAPYFRTARIAGLGVLLPPSYAQQWTRGHPRAVESMNRWETRMERIFPFPSLADHYLIELVRTSQPG